MPDEFVFQVPRGAALVVFLVLRQSKLGSTGGSYRRYSGVAAVATPKITDKH